MTGQEFYQFSYKIEMRTGSGDGFICAGIVEPGVPDIFHSKRNVKKTYDNGEINYTTEYDTTVTHDGTVCMPTNSYDDEEEGKDYGEYHEGDDVTTYEGDTVTKSTIISYAQGRAVGAIGGSWSNAADVAGGTWESAHGVGIGSSLGSGPSFTYSAGVAGASAQQYQMFLRPPYIPVRLVFTYLGADTTFNLSGTGVATWTPGFPATDTTPNTITIKAFPLPFP